MSKPKQNDEAQSASKQHESRAANAAMLNALVGGLVAAVVSGSFALAQKRDEVTHQYVATAVAVLSKEPDKNGLTPDQVELRRWACKLLNSKLDQEVKLDEKACKALAEGSAQLYGSGYTDIPSAYDTYTTHPSRAERPARPASGEADGR